MDTTEYLPKPSLIQSLDVSSILSKHFGSLFLSDCVDPEIIENLTISQGSTDEDHRNYVAKLIQITIEREQLFERTQHLRKHIFLARDQSIRDDLALEEENKDYAYLHLPPAESTFYKYIDNDLLRANGLIAPEDIIMTAREHGGDRTKMESSSPINMSGDSRHRRNSAKETRSPSVNKMSEYRLPPIDRPTSSEKSKKNKDPKRLKAPDMMLAVDRDVDKFILDSMAAKNNYLKNPRHLPPRNSSQSKDWLIKSNCKDESPMMFIPIPEFIEFSDYEIGKVYEKMINFRNVTSVLRNIRVLPPKTRYFSLGLGQFPGEKGLVAAGMSCQYAIRFSPDSLGDFDDEITVETQGGNNFVVKLASKRPRPSLSGGSLWDMGHSLVFGLKVIHYTIKNNGGLGRFCLIDSAMWPVSNPKSYVGNKQIILEPFIIRPSFFELRTDETITLELLFCPINVGIVEREFFVLCDNCHMKTFKIKGEGEIASILMESIEDGVSVPEIDESTDISAQMLIKFGELNPFTYCQKLLVLKNESHTEVPFCWKIIKPNLKVPSSETDETGENVVQNRTLDFDSAFLIEPPFGVFPSNDSMAFTITFAPLEVKPNHSVLHLVLQGIPDIKTEQTEPANDVIQKSKSLIQISEETFPDTQPITENMNCQKKYISLNDVTSLEIEVKGTCIPLDVYLNPPAIIISGDLLINTPVRKQLQICNRSMCPVNVNWKNSDSDNHIFAVEPQLGMIESGEIGIVDVCIVASKPGFVRDTLMCVVDNMEKQLLLVIEAKFKGPEIEIDQNNLDFGLVKAKYSVHRNLTLVNKSSINCAWRARIGGSADIDLFDEIQIVPWCGVLAPLQNQLVAVTLHPQIAKNIDCGLEIALEQGSTRYLNVRACVQSPQVVLRHSIIDVSGKLFVNVPSTFDIQLCNHSHLMAQFDWLPIIGQKSDIVSVIFDPSHGVINPSSELTVTLTVTCSDRISIDDLILPCSIEGMSEPVLLQIVGTVQGPNLICSIVDESEIEDTDKEHRILTLNFGDNVQLFEDVKRYICIENTTSIVTEYSLSVEHFKAANEDVEASQDRTKIRPNLADRQSKPDKLAHYDFCKSKLRDKNGLAVGFSPARGSLAGYERLLVSVIVYNDMWGSYKDVVKISGNAQSLEIEPILIPLSVTVKGVPIEFTMTSGRKEQKPILRLGSRPLGHEQLSRQVRLNNKSPCDIYINWEMYSKSDDSDDKILDLILNCGDPFPIQKTGTAPDNGQYLDSTRFTDVNESLASNSTRVPNILIDSYRAGGLISHDNDDYSDDPLISLILRPHDGIISTRPISFDPPQLMIASESFGFVTISFDPRSLDGDDHNCIRWDHNHGISYDNYLLGFVSLSQRDLRRDNFMLRQHQYGIEQVKLDITGRILRPSLQIEYPDDEEEVQFNVPFSSLLNTKASYNLSKSMTFTKSVTLRNLKDCEIMFSLKTRPPFEISNSKLRDGAVLGIGDVIKIEIKFTLDKRQMSLLGDNSLYGSDESKCLRLERQNIAESVDRSVKSAVFRDVVSINYDHTNIDQLIPLRATIGFPEFILSKSDIDFGTGFIGETSTEHFRIINKSQCSMILSLRLDCGDSNSVFGISDEEFFIPYKELETNANQCTVTVCFSPKQAMAYDATIVITGLMGEDQCSIPIRGYGSYDNQYQRKY